jgi:predicted dehydrogenase
MKSVNRRKFIKGSATAGAALAAMSPWAKALGANGDIRVAVVGFRSRGQSHLKGFDNLDGVRVVALCDVDKDVLDAEAAKRPGVKAFTDYRKMLEDKDIDVVSIATPNHTHALISIESIQAGKDVYVEKPVSHNVWEGRQIVKAARKYNKIVQTGTQSRSNPGMRDLVKYLHDGNLGRIKVARGLCYKRRKSIGKVAGAQDVPDSIDYNLWTGPAPMKPLMREKLHYDWHWVRDTGAGDLGNQGIHQMDIARWILQEDALSPEIFALGGRVGYDDDGDTANTELIFHNYRKAPLIFEVRGLGRWSGENARPKYRGVDVGVVVDCEDGYMIVPSYSKGTAYSHSGKVIKEFSGGADHYANFIKAVRSRKHSDLNADIEEGHISSALCHTGNISYYLGSEASPGAILDSIQGDSLAAESFGRTLEHLAVNEVDLNKTPLAMGVHLKMNPKTERFIGNEAANRLLTREYRKPFVVPAEV